LLLVNNITILQKANIYLHFAQLFNRWQLFFATQLYPQAQ